MPRTLSAPLTPLTLVALVALVALLVGCGEPEAGPPGDEGPRVEVASGPLSDAEVEAVARDVLPEPASSGPRVPDGGDPRGSVGARLDYGDQHVDVVVGPPHDESVADACAESVIECAELDAGPAAEGGVLTLLWQQEVPEEDPGVVVLILEREGEFSMVRWGGDVPVTGDPRELDLDVPVDAAADLLRDERLRYVVP